MNNPIKVAIVGCGNIAGGYDLKTAADSVMTHVKAFKNLSSVQVVGAYDLDYSKAKLFGGTWQIPHVFSDLKAMLSECGADIVSICSPNQTHFEIFQTISDFKPKAVLCEKPLAMKCDEARKMIDDSSKKEILLAVNYLRRWDTNLTALGERIKKGEFGNFQMARVLYTKGVFHNASHAINLFQDWMGECEGVEVHRVLKKENEDCLADFNLRFERCPEVHFQALEASNYNNFEIDLHFSKARVLLPGGGAEIKIDWASPSQIAKGEKTLGASQEKIKGTINVAMQNVVTNLVEALKKKKPLKMSSDEALKTIEICDQVRKKAYE